jgi:hypothetical protein
MGSACARERHQTRYQEKVSESFSSNFLVELDIRCQSGVFSLR